MGPSLWRTGFAVKNKYALPSFFARPFGVVFGVGFPVEPHTCFMYEQTTPEDPAKRKCFGLNDIFAEKGEGSSLVTSGIDAIEFEASLRLR